MEKFRLTLEELTWKTPWAVIQRMLIDAHKYEPKKPEDEKVKKSKLAKDNAEEVRNYINSLK